MENIPVTPRRFVQDILFKGGINSVIIPLMIILFLFSCKQPKNVSADDRRVDIYSDIPFIQEYHEGFMVSGNINDNEVRSIAVDRESNIWIATASGVFKKEAGRREWEEIISGEERGPSYSVVVNSSGDILIGTWNGLYRYSDNILAREDGPVPPVSEICADIEGDYALGPYGIWRFVDKVGKAELHNCAFCT
jgi:ligand-binding sensor domain-containing protein